MEWNKKTFVIITGASKGIGRTIAVEFSKRVAAGSKFILLARSASGLEESKSLCSPDVVVETLTANLESPDAQKIKNFIAEAAANPDDYERAVIVHNAGSLGNLQRSAKDFEDLDEINNYFNLNVGSMILLNTMFLKAFPKSEKYKRLVINITSLCGIKPFQGFALYCTGKATREMFLKVLALEEPTVKVLNYSPGPVLTDMADEILAGLKCHELRKPFEDLRTNGSYLTPEDTIGKLIQLLESGNFESGDHVDVFDI
ncbi:sepiapterin reductase-like [Neocloeon triangulifer]|uniref:sepiapterin reductase-like n=1 Tax=Neocloeon triangulifer TaxID=2078957 RepID=UPI00286F68B1|nr:sepiapterin reductase-like [Neocloeon triangulifer]XP_059484538.1 sepiapterin reductase-like [Neocloeon triangulifer]